MSTPIKGWNTTACSEDLAASAGMCTLGLNSRLAYLISPGVRVHFLQGFHPALEAVVQRLARGDGKAERQMSVAECTADAQR